MLIHLICNSGGGGDELIALLSTHRHHVGIDACHEATGWYGRGSDGGQGETSVHP